MNRETTIGDVSNHPIITIQLIHVNKSGPEGIRTLGRSIKSRTLYLAELQAPLSLLITFS